MRIQTKQKLRQLRRWRIRKKVQGTPERPRMAVRFSNENIYVQFIDDTKGVTIASASTTSKAISGDTVTGTLGVSMWGDRDGNYYLNSGDLTAYVIVQFA